MNTKQLKKAIEATGFEIVHFDQDQKDQIIISTRKKPKELNKIELLPVSEDEKFVPFEDCTSRIELFNMINVIITGINDLIEVVEELRKK